MLHEGTWERSGHFNLMKELCGRTSARAQSVSKDTYMAMVTVYKENVSC